MPSCPHFGEGIHTIVNAQRRSLGAHVSGGRGRSVRRLHGGGGVGSGSCRMSGSLPGSYYGHCAVRLLGDCEAWAVPTASHSFLEKIGHRNQQ